MTDADMITTQMRSAPVYRRERSASLTPHSQPIIR
jgi:hypothetical protein